MMPARAWRARMLVLGVLLLWALAALPGVAARPLPFAGVQMANAQMVEPDAADPACAATADSAILSADRGIGGTGISQQDAIVAERGIGGTGVPGSVLRGIPAGGRPPRGSALLGTITGLPDLCIDGTGVAVDRSLRLTVDGVPSPEADLRIGGIAAVVAHGGAGDLHAVSISLRHEVSGPITALPPAGNTLVVVGQQVVLGARTRAPAGLRVGDWVAVSGLRDLGGVIHASRLDRRDPGDIIVYGQPVRAAGGWTLGGLALHLSARATPTGARVRLVGQDDHGALRVTAITNDPPLPASDTHRFAVTGFARLDGQTLRLGNGLQAPTGPNFGPPPPQDTPIVVQFATDEHGALTALSCRPAAAP